MIDLNSYRNKEGFIDLNKVWIKDLEAEVRGDAKKLWVILNDDRRFLFKTAFFSNGAKEKILYQLYSALLTSEIANMLEIPCAQYDLAIYDGEMGTISPDFIKVGESITSGVGIITNVCLVHGKTLNNCLKDFKQLFNYYFEGGIKGVNLYEEFAINYYMLDFVLCMFDRHQNNWGIINSGNKSESRLTPRYDTELIAETYLGKNRIKKLIKFYDPQTGINPSEIDLWSDELETKFGYRSMWPRNNLDMECFCSENYEIAKKGFELISKIDVKKAFDNIEAKIGTKLPQEYKKWLTISINYRISVIKRTLLSVETTKAYYEEFKSSNKR